MVFRRLSPHEELLVSVLRRPADQEELRDKGRLLDDLHERAAFQRHADQHGVLGLALSVLNCTPGFADVLSPSSAVALFSPLSMLRRQAAFWDLERGRVLHRLQAGDINPLVLKGAALRMTTYTQSVERSFADLDVLLREHEMEGAVAALESADYSHAFGDAWRLYKAHHYHFPMRHPGGFMVELHWALTEPSAQVRLDAEAFRARSIRLDGQYAARIPSPEDMVLHLICQNLEDGFGKLRRTVDIDRILSQRKDFDWPYLIHSADRGNARTAAALALQLSRLLLGTRLPISNAAEMFAVRRVARAGIASLRPVIVHVHQFERGNDVRRGLLRLWTARGSRSWLWALREKLFADYYRFWFLDSGDPPPSVLNRTVSIAKLLTLQTWSYVTALAGLMTRRGRAALRFWTSSISDTSNRRGS